MTYKIKKSLYLEVADLLRKSIQDDKYLIDNRLPSEIQLSEELGVSRGTLREAMSVLEKEGMIYRKHGVGSFVKNKPMEIIEGLESLEFNENDSQKHDNLIQTIHKSGQMRVDGKISKQLNVDEGTTCFFLEVVTYNHDMPIAYFQEIYPKEIIKKEKDMYNRKSFKNPISFLKKVTDQSIGQFQSVMKVELPPVHLMEILSIDTSVPLLSFEGTLYSENKTPLMFTKQYFRGDQYQFTLIRS